MPATFPPFDGVLNTPLRSTYDGADFLPASQATAGYAITSNYEFAGEVDFWNLVNSVGGSQGFYFYQKIAADDYALLMKVEGDAVSSQVSFGYGYTTKAYIAVTTTGVTLGSTNGTPFRISSGSFDPIATFISLQSPASIAQRVLAKTADFAPSASVGSDEFGVNYTTFNAVGTVIVTLPSAAATSWENTFTVSAAQILRIQCPANHTIRFGSAVSAAAGKAEASSLGSSARIVKLNANTYLAVSFSGSWTVT
jgi:hypothetical protein